MALSKYSKTDLKSKINKNHEASISAKERASQFKNDMNIMDDRMYCQFCAKVVNHVRKSTVLEHIGSAAHRLHKAQEKKQAAEAQSQSNRPISADDGDITGGNNRPTSTAAINKTKLQMDISTSFCAATEQRSAKAKINYDLITALLAADIPFEKNG